MGEELHMSDLPPRKEAKGTESGGSISMGQINRHAQKNPTDNVEASPKDKKVVKNNTPISEVLKDKQWDGEKIAVIAGGESLKDFDFSKLEGFKIIAINRSFEEVEPDIIFATDARLWPWIEKGDLGEKVKKRFDETKAIKVWSDIGGVPLPEEIHIAKAIGRPGMSKTVEEGIGYATNSGYGALNLALLLAGPKSKVYLLGYDMKGKRWYGKYPSDPEEETKEEFAVPFNLHKDEILGFGIDVVNVNPDSKLDIFPKLSFEEAFGVEQKKNKKQKQKKSYPKKI